MTNYGATIGNLLGTTLIVKTTSKYLLPANKKLFKQLKMKGGKRRR